MTHRLLALASLGLTPVVLAALLALPRDAISTPGIAQGSGSITGQVIWCSQLPLRVGVAGAEVPQEAVAQAEAGVAKVSVVVKLARARKVIVKEPINLGEFRRHFPNRMDQVRLREEAMALGKLGIHVAHHGIEASPAAGRAPKRQVEQDSDQLAFVVVGNASFRPPVIGIFLKPRLAARGLEALRQVGGPALKLANFVPKPLIKPLAVNQAGA